jgi:hypothetical protein
LRGLSALDLLATASVGARPKREREVEKCGERGRGREKFIDNQIDD